MISPLGSARTLTVGRRTSAVHEVDTACVRVGALVAVGDTGTVVVVGTAAIQGGAPQASIIASSGASIASIGFFIRTP
jgi:hypothetical protein